MLSSVCNRKEKGIFNTIHCPPSQNKLIFYFQTLDASNTSDTIWSIYFILSMLHLRLKSDENIYNHVVMLKSIRYKYSIRLAKLWHPCFHSSLFLFMTLSTRPTVEFYYSLLFLYFSFRAAVDSLNYGNTITATRNKYLTGNKKEQKEFNKPQK